MTDRWHPFRRVSLFSEDQAAEIDRVYPLPRKKRCRSMIPSQVAAHINACVFGESPWPIFLTGPPGTGKTCAALCVCDRIEWAMYFTLREFCSTRVDANMGNLYSHGIHAVKRSDKEFIDLCSRYEMIVLDEVGLSSEVSDHERDSLHRLLDAREGLPMILVGNHGLDRLSAAYGDQVASRVSAGTVIEMALPDQRPAQGTRVRVDC